MVVVVVAVVVVVVVADVAMVVTCCAGAAAGELAPSPLAVPHAAKPATNSPAVPNATRRVHERLTTPTT